jgi:site-specific DNA-methyltransferase (adenine-specific)
MRGARAVKPVIKCNDNLAELRNLPSKSVDIAYIDPPYATQRDMGDFPDKWSSIGAFIDFMEPRIHELHRVLKPTGTLYVHIDEHADAYLRVATDKIFEPKNFVNEIIWAYSGGGAPKSRFASKHDTILMYARDNSQRKFNTVFAPYKVPGGKHSGGKPYRDEGKIMDDWWADIPPVSTASRERIGYATQKPERLLERIITASSDPGDVVLDAFAGSGTTCAVAKNLGRKSICIDVNPRACKIMKSRLG